MFRHEIAYVLGQMQHPASVPALVEGLRRVDEPMVRHECAEALGSVAVSEEAKAVLRNYVNDDERVVRESCIVALDMWKWETNES